MNLTEIRNSSFDHVYIIENRNLLKGIHPVKDTDLVLCLDFGLYHTLKKEGYTVAYLDHLAGGSTANRFNAEMNYYLQNWFKDEQGKSVLKFDGSDIGDALLLDVLNDITYFCHFFLNINALKKIDYKTLSVVAEDLIIAQVLDKLEMPFDVIKVEPEAITKAVYNFPIIKWTNEQVNSVSLKTKIRKALSKGLDIFFSVTDLFRLKNRKNILIQNYHPTASVIQTLLKDKKARIILGEYIPGKDILRQRRFTYKKFNSENEAAELLNKFKKANKTKWIYEGINLGGFLEERMYPSIERNVEKAISLIKGTKYFLSKNPIELFIPITNLWLNNRLIMHYCKNNGIPVFMIINGLLNVEHWRDAHDSDWVNCYSESLKIDYFKNKYNALALGDPRMDNYANQPLKVISRNNPVIIIGAAGYSHIDQSSYVAFEFDFVYDILAALEKLNKENYKAQIILKVRANGYAHLYQTFINEYFPLLNVVIMQNESFSSIIKQADLYISFFSQTIMEAASLGIPTIYYKKDEAEIFRPYDNKSELVTAVSTQELESNIRDFYADSAIFQLFLVKETLEKYIGFLDGNNLDRNVGFIYSILNKQLKNQGK